MSKFISGEDRNQSTLFPESLEDYVSEDNTVRVIDVFIEVRNTMMPIAQYHSSRSLFCLSVDLSKI